VSKSRLPAFTGFDRPQDNFYRLPYSDALDWFQFWRTVRAKQIRRTVLGPLKVAEYVIKHTWGQLEFHNPVALSISNFEHGGRYRFLTDAGTGLQRRPIIEAIRFCGDIGLLDIREDKSGTAHTERRYRIRLHSDGQPAPPDAPIARLDAFTGFPTPDQNYFIVPKFWTDLTSELNSDVLILTVEYLFCHCWNWSRERRAETVWLAINDIQEGRRYATRRNASDASPERYDSGIGFTTESVRAACHLGVANGLLVRRQLHNASGQLGDEQFSLRTTSMPQGRGYRHFTYTLEFGDLSDLYAPKPQTADADRLSAPPGELAAPAQRLGAPGDPLSAPADRLDAPRQRLDQPAQRLDAPLYVPTSVPSFSRTDASPSITPATTPASSGQRQDSAPISGVDAVQTHIAPLTDSAAIEQVIALALSGERETRLSAMQQLCGDQIDPGAAIAFVSQWLMRNYVYESTRRNAVAAHPDPAVLVRAIAQFEREERDAPAQPASTGPGAADIRARGRKIGGLFKIAARVVALDAAFRSATHLLAAQSAQRDAQIRAAEATRRRQSSAVLSPEQVMLTDMLAWQGLSTNDARALAVAYHDAHASRALPYACTWINYALSQSSLHSPLAFVRKRVETLDRPPATASVEGPAMAFWLWREELLSAHPQPLEQPVIAFERDRQRREQRDRIALDATDARIEGADSAALDADNDTPLAAAPLTDATAAVDDDPELSRVFGPAARRALDLVQLRRWRDALVSAFARDAVWRAELARVIVVSVDRDARQAVLRLRDATPIDAAVFAVQGLPRLNEHSALALSIDPDQADDALLDVIACWRDAVREYRAQFGALDNVPVDGASGQPISRVWPSHVSADRSALTLASLEPAAANAPACDWLARRLSEILGRAVRVVPAAEMPAA
jgi:hypothetical protein